MTARETPNFSLSRFLLENEAFCPNLYHRLCCVQSSHLDNSKSKSNDPLLQHLKASAFFSERLSLGRQEILSVYPVEIPHHLVDGDVIKGSASESTRLM